MIAEEEGEVEDEDLIQREDMVVTVSHLGYIKRVPLSTYRAQRRGGKGRGGMQMREEDFVSRLFVASTHTPVLFFSSRGKVYKEKVWRLPLAAPQARGKALINILPLEQGETITTIMPLPEDETTWGKLDVMFATTKGTVRRNKLSDFVDVRPSGIIAMKLEEGDAIVDVQICTEKDDVLLTADGGQCIRFAVTDVRVFSGRTSIGVRGINARRRRQGDLDVDPAPRRRHRRGARGLSQARQRGAPRRRRGSRSRPRRMPRRPRRRAGAIELGEKRYVEMSAAEQFVLTISERGYGKRSSSYEYRITGRGGKGIVAMSIWKARRARRRSGQDRPAGRPRSRSRRATRSCWSPTPGKLIRTPVAGIRIAGRSTQGVIVLNTADDERVVSVERLSEEDEAEVAAMNWHLFSAFLAHHASCCFSRRGRSSR